MDATENSIYEPSRETEPLQSYKLSENISPVKVGLSAANNARNYNINPYNKYLLEALDEGEVRHSYKLALRELNDKDGNLKEQFPFIRNWVGRANHDSYMDLMKSLAVPFMPLGLRPKVLFAISGREGSGKSAYFDLLEMIVGIENCSHVSIKDITQTLEIATTKSFRHQYRESMLSAIVNISDREIHNVAIPRQNELRAILEGNSPYKCTFYAGFYEQPVWDRAYTKSLGDATIVIPFLGDKRGQHASLKEFEEKFYTPDVISRLIGQILALARWYTKKGECMPFSERGKRLRHSPMYFAGNFSHYMDAFTRHFSGYVNKEALMKDYLKWCELMGTDPLPKKHVYELLKEFPQNHVRKLANTRSGRKPVKKGGYYIKYWRFTGRFEDDGRYMFYYGEFIPELGTELGKAISRMYNGKRIMKSSGVYLLEHCPRSERFSRRSQQKHKDEE